MVCGMLSYQGLNQLHVIPQKTSVDTENYIENILEKFCLPVMNSMATVDSVLDRCMVPSRSDNIFTQDGAYVHRSAKTQRWCREHLCSFWANGT